MKIGEYEQMMAYLLRPRQKFAIGGGVVEGEDLGSREGFYKGSSLETQLDKIKELFLKGKTDREIAEIIKQPRGTVSGVINSMKNGLAPVTISATELKNRPAPGLSNIAKSQEATNRINKAYKELTERLGKPPTRAQLAEAADVVPGTIRSNTPNLKFTSAADEGAKASTKKFKERKVDKPTRTTFEGVKGAKFKNAAQEAEYKKFLELAAEYPKGSPKNPYNKKFFAKKFNMPETDVESIHKIVREKYNINYSKSTDTSAGIRADQLREKSDIALEQEYTKLKKGERIGNPDLAHRVSKKYNVTTANLGLDNPLINRVIVKPNERDISRLYDQRIKIENKYKLKDGTFKKPSNADIKILEQINNDVETLARETKGRLSAVINDPTDLNKPYGSLGVDPSKTIGGGMINVDLKDVRKLSLEDQAILKLNLLELKEKELNKTPKMIADEFKDVLSKPSVRKRIENIISKGKMETPYIRQSKQILALSAIPDLTTADKIPTPEKTKTREMFEQANKRLSDGPTLGMNLGLGKALGSVLKYAPTPAATVGLSAGFGIDPESSLDRTILGTELAAAPALVKQSSRITSNPLLRSVLNLGLSPQMAMRAARVASPIGIASLIGEAGYNLGKQALSEQDRIDAMSPEEREEFLAEQESLLDFSA